MQNIQSILNGLGAVWSEISCSSLLKPVGALYLQYCLIFCLKGRRRLIVVAHAPTCKKIWHTCLFSFSDHKCFGAEAKAASYPHLLCQWSPTHSNICCWCSLPDPILSRSGGITKFQVSKMGGGWWSQNSRYPKWGGGGFHKIHFGWVSQNSLWQSLVTKNLRLRRFSCYIYITYQSSRLQWSQITWLMNWNPQNFRG